MVGGCSDSSALYRMFDAHSMQSQGYSQEILNILKYAPAGDTAARST